MKEWVARNDVKPMIALEAYEFAAAMVPHLQAALSGGEVGLVRDDLYPTLLTMVLETTDDRDLIALLGPGLTEVQKEMLKIAVAAGGLRAGGMDAAAERLVDDAARRLGPDARKINALYTAGYLQSMFSWKMAYYRMTNPDAAPRQFASWFADQLQFFDKAIFVNWEWTAGNVDQELTQRLVRHPSGKVVNQVRVWAAGTNNMMTAAAGIRQFVKKHKQFKCGAEDREYGKARGMEVMVFRTGKIDHHTTSMPHDIDVLT